MRNTSFNYEFIHYGEDGNGDKIRIARVFTDDRAAKDAAGRLSKKINGPVDVARDNGQHWSDRYLTTASPSRWHAKGYSCERIS